MHEAVLGISFSAMNIIFMRRWFPWFCRFNTTRYQMSFILIVTLSVRSEYGICQKAPWLHCPTIQLLSSVFPSITISPRRHDHRSCRRCRKMYSFFVFFFFFSSVVVHGVKVTGTSHHLHIQPLCVCQAAAAVCVHATLWGSGSYGLWRVCLSMVWCDARMASLPSPYRLAEPRKKTPLSHTHTHTHTYKHTHQTYTPTQNHRETGLLLTQRRKHGKHPLL